MVRSALSPRLEKDFPGKASNDCLLLGVYHQQLFAHHEREWHFIRHPPMPFHGQLTFRSYYQGFSSGMLAYVTQILIY